ncbi:MAG TPA: hypothetical protein VHU83_06665 [Bryobacteraceae bacterium]|jgi:hypothetical protein|nr:hypothetical protein [Bryobacteraceae bacterium]
MPKSDVSEELRLERERLELEREHLELEELRERVNVLKSRKAIQQQAHAQVERDLRDFDAQQKARQRTCTHMKGGLDVQGVKGNGTDSANYSIIKHRMPHGKIMLLCTRCQLMKMPGDPGYDEMFRLPTKNTMSESAQFTFTPITV